MNPALPHPRDGEAAEYVIGTLSGAERAAFEQDMAGDPSLMAAVRAWEERLTPLSDATSPVEPGATLWPAIEARLGSAPPAGEVVQLSEIRALRRSRAIWRGLAVGAGSIAAALAVLFGADRAAREASPSALVAVVNRSGELPALIVRVDQRAGTVQIRSIGAETPAGHSLELWSVVAGQAPRSLGLVSAALSRVPLREAAPAPEGATIAVSVEPAGGSPTGNPTGPVVYSGRLVPERP
jgi:anti-sigma-K factor RskA